MFNYTHKPQLTKRYLSFLYAKIEQNPRIASNYSIFLRFQETAVQCVFSLTTCDISPQQNVFIQSSFSLAGMPSIRVLTTKNYFCVKYWVHHMTAEACLPEEK